MKDLRYTSYRNLNAYAKCKKGYELIYNLIAYRPEFLNNPLPL